MSINAVHSLVSSNCYKNDRVVISALDINGDFLQVTDSTGTHDAQLIVDARVSINNKVERSRARHWNPSASSYSDRNRNIRRRRQVILKVTHLTNDGLLVLQKMLDSSYTPLFFDRNSEYQGDYVLLDDQYLMKDIRNLSGREFTLRFESCEYVYQSEIVP